MGKAIRWEHLRILPCFPGREATSTNRALLFAKFSRLWQANGQRGRAGKRKPFREGLMEEEGENPNLQPGSEGSSLATFPPPNPCPMQRISNTCLLCVYRWHFSAFVDSQPRFRKKPFNTTLLLQGPAGHQALGSPSPSTRPSGKKRPQDKMKIAAILSVVQGQGPRVQLEPFS